MCVSALLVCVGEMLGGKRVAFSLSLSRCCGPLSGEMPSLNHGQEGGFFGISCP